MSSAPLLGRADGRPRVHIWPQKTGAMWSLSPTGRPTYAATPGAALDAAIDHLGTADVVAFIVQAPS